jgi:hypothetical protein
LYDQNGIGETAVVVPSDTGVFSITGIVPGLYKIYVAPTDVDNFHVAVYYPSTQFDSEAEEFHVTAGDIFTNINVSLPLGGKISGIVTFGKYGRAYGISKLLYDTKGS